MVLLGLYSRHIVGWAMTDRPNTDLVLDALRMAMARRAQQHGFIHHTDQGVHQSLGDQSPSDYEKMQAVA